MSIKEQEKGKKIIKNEMKDETNRQNVVKKRKNEATSERLKKEKLNKPLWWSKE